jgi:hypothetical protein
MQKRASQSTDFRETWYGASTKIDRETPNLVKNGQKYRAPSMKT